MISSCDGDMDHIEDIALQKSTSFLFEVYVSVGKSWKDG